MGRRRRASLVHGTGIRREKGRALPGYYVRWSEFPDGERVQRRRCFSSKVEAQRFIRAFNAAQDIRSPDERRVPSLREAARLWIAGHAGSARSTVNDYRRAVAALARVTHSDRPIDRITGEDIDRLIATVRERSVSVSHLAKYVRCLKVFFNWCVKRYHISSPIGLATSAPTRSESRRRPPLNDQVIGRLLACCENDDQRLAILVAATTGLDRSQIEQMTAAWIDFDHDCITLVRAKTARRKPRHVALPLHVQIRDQLRRACDLNPTGPILPLAVREKRRFRGSDGLDRDWFVRVRAAAGCPEILFRDLRAFASAWVQRAPGVTLAQASRLLGHASVETTAAHYTIPDPSLAAAVRSLPLPGASGPAAPPDSAA